MKVMIISDIHGNVENLLRVKEIYEEEHFEKLIILGDVEGNAKISEILAFFKGKMIIVRGNCDLPIYDKYLCVKPVKLFFDKINGYNCYFSHGHEGMPNLEFYDQTIYFQGHTHRGLITNYFSLILANPGSISRPRNNVKSYLEFNDKSLILYSLDNKTIISEKILN